MGVGVPCVLICDKKSEPKFNVRGQRCLFYDSIRDLQGQLTIELSALIFCP